MYIEVWELIYIFSIVACAFFSYKSGWKAGMKSGVHMVIEDLAENDIISVDEYSDVTSVGRYDGKSRTGGRIEFKNENEE